MNHRYFCSPTYLGSLAALLTISSSSAEEIARESFEGSTSPLFSNTGLISSPDRFYDTDTDFWTATDGSDIRSATEDPAAYTGKDGNRYWAGQDLNDPQDGESGGTAAASDTVVFGPVPISGFINLRFDALFAADGIIGGIYRYDPGEGLEVAWSIDGGPFTQALAFKAVGPAGTNNQQLRQDTNLNGFGDGTQLVPAFANYGFTIPSTGTNITIRVTGISTGSQEEFAFDNLTISGDAAVTNQAPIASILSASDVGEPEIGDNSYSFDVTYSDDSAIAVASINTADITVTGPGGALTVTGASSSVTTNGSPRVVTYTVTPPGGSWDSSDNGTYTVAVNANQVGDDGGPQLFVTASTLGDFAVAADNTPPFVASTFAQPVVNGDLGGGSYPFTVTYGDVGSVDASSISPGDVTVTGPGGPLAVTSAIAQGPNSTALIVQYTVTPPGGTWDVADNGTYTISVNTNEVSDVVGAFIPFSGGVGTFEVDSGCIRIESFEGAAPNYDTGLINAPDQFFASATDFWTVTDGSNINSASASPAAYSGQNRNRYWAGQDLDDAGDGEGGNNSDTLVFGPIPINGFTDLSFAGLFAADGILSGTPRYDSGEGLEVAWSIDGGAFTTALAFKAAGATNTQLRKDDDLNGVGEGDLLGTTFSSHTFPIASTGSAITIRVTGILNGSQEEVAFDNIKVRGTPPTVNQAPQVSNLVATEVGETEIGDTAYFFDVVYSDDSAVAASTIDVADLTVTGPGGTLTITGVSVSPSGDGTPLTATYTITPPGGDWDATDNGTYTITTVANQIGDNDTTQLFAPAGSIGTFDVAADNSDPVINEVFAPNRTFGNLGDTSYTFQIVYTDVADIDASSIGPDDITVTGPGGPLTVVSGTTTDPNGSPLTATYVVTPPGGVWESTDNGVYTIGVAASEISDTAGGSVAAATNIRTFDMEPSVAARESFELMGPSYDSGLITAPNKFFTSSSDFWTDTDGSNIISATADPAAYSGENGFRYWAGQDLTSTSTVEMGPIPISNFTDLSFSGLFAADGIFGGLPRYDSGEGLEVAWSIDGGTFTTALAFKSEATAGTSNGRILKDTDLDGIGDGAVLGTIFTLDSFPIPGTGDTLTIRVTGIINQSQEEIAFDDLKVSGTANFPPVASPNSLTRAVGSTAKISLADRIADDTDPEGASPLSVTAVNYTGGNGGSVTIIGNFAFYNPNGHPGADSFTYTVSDPDGATATAVVTVNVAADTSAPSFNLVNIEDIAGGAKRAIFAGIPGRDYSVETSPDMAPGNWTPRATITADTLGRIIFDDATPPATQFYRTVNP